MTARQSYHLTFARFSPSLSVRSFTAAEAANTAYRVEITATSTDSSLPLSSYLNQRATFEIRPQEAVSSEVAAAFSAGSDDAPAKQWQGIITSCEKLSVSKDETVYRFVLEPRFAALKHFQSSRLFQNQTVPDIVAAVFKHHGFSGVDYRFQKSRSYTVREYVTQYLESDFAFINRLCEEEGIWYAFEQYEQHGDVVVFGDSPEHYFRDQSLPVSYRPHAGLESTGTEALFNLSIRHNRNKRGENGEGFELRTDGWGAVRAGKGILVSAQNQDANGKVLDMDDAIAQLEQALSLAKSLNKAAQTANNHHTDEETQRGRLKDALKDLKEAGLIQTAPAGIATATQQSQLHTANENIHLVSGNHTDITAGQSLTAHAAESLNLFAQSSGIKVQANQGKVEVQAQNDELQLNALKDATLTSSAGKITIAAKEEILITCKGAYIKLANGEVEIGSPKVVRVRAPLVVSGSNSVNYPFFRIMGACSHRFQIKNNDTGEIEKDFPYLLKYKKEYFFGYSDNLGFTDRIYTEVPEEVEIFIGRNALLKYFEIENNCSIEDYYIGVKDNE